MYGLVRDLIQYVGSKIIRLKRRIGRECYIGNDVVKNNTIIAKYVVLLYSNSPIVTMWY